MRYSVPPHPNRSSISLLKPSLVVKPSGFVFDLCEAESFSLNETGHGSSKRFTAEAATEYAFEFQLPFFLKGRLHGAIKITSRDQLPSLLKAQAAGGFPVILQQFIPGIEYDVAAISDREGMLIGAVP